MTGAAKSGKTVFLVSLIDHLMNFRSSNDWSLKVPGRKGIHEFKALMPTFKSGDPYVFLFAPLTRVDYAPGIAEEDRGTLALAA